MRCRSHAPPSALPICLSIGPLAGVFALVACGTTPPQPGPQELDATTALAPQASHCIAPSGASAAPNSIKDALDLINALPKPLALPCFVEALQRPLRVHATVSTISAQPSVGRRSPRIFLFFDSLTLSIAPAGVGSTLLELGEQRDGLRSLKGEVQFPVADTLASDAPFTRILYQGTRTSCSLCHAAERPDDSISYAPAYSSQALRPSLPADHVTVAELTPEVDACDPSSEPDRCALLHSLYSQGAPVDIEFPSSFQVFH